MAWTFLAVLAGSQKRSRATSSPSLIVKTTATPKRSSYHEWLEEIWALLRFGMTFEPSEPGCSRPSKSSTEAFRVRTFQWQDAEKAWGGAEAGYFSKSSACLGSFDPDSSSWKTFQLSVFGVEPLLSESWPASGMTVDGRLYPLPPLERTISESGGGFWRTPDTGAGGTSGLLKAGKTHRKSGAAITMRLVDQVNNQHLWPTPRAGKTSSENPEVWAKRQAAGKVSTPPLGMAVRMFPTPRTTGLDGGSNSRNAAKARGMWPTPCATDHKGSGVKGTMRDRLDYAAERPDGARVGGSLNPTWVEWLMGYPCGWTALEDWATQWFRPKRAQPSKD